MPQSSNNNNKAYEAFASVDQMVSKPVLGSDGAASWQEFKKEYRVKDESVAPSLQVKHADRMGTGLSSMAEERAHEEKIRRAAGDAAVGSGYTTFQKKNDAEEAQERKRRKRIEQKIRPDKKPYFQASASFDGWRFDYVFTTRDRGTGYYWDGTDSVKKLNGTLPDVPEPAAATMDDSSSAEKKEETNKPPSKRRKKEETTKQKNENVNHNPRIITTRNQVEEAIQRRKERLQRPPRGLVVADSSQEECRLMNGWESAKDPASGKTYYFHRESGQRQWDPPIENLPEGWKSAKDPRNGKTYYYHTNGETSWEVPQQAK